jgi:hypothetical protein
VLAVGLGCAEAPPPAEWHEEAGYRWRQLAPTKPASPGFTRLDQSTTGIAFANHVSESAALKNRILVQGGGVALGDVDGDGLTDLFLAKTEGPSALYRNLGGLRFEEIAATAGVALGDRAVTGAILHDVDGDRDRDLLVNALGGPNALLVNDGTGRFREDTLFPGRASRLGSTTSTLADIDGDGDLDLYTTNYKAYTTLDRLSPQDRAFDQIVRRRGEREFEVVERYRQDYRVIVREDLRGVSLIQRADPDALYLNDGSGRFTPVPMGGSSRFLDEEGQPLAEPREDFGLAARFYDVDGDRDPDLYVANDFEDPDQFWINDGRGTFRLITRTAQRTTSNSGMSVDFGDIDRDGWPDLFEVDMLSRDTRRLRSQIPTQTVLPKQPGVIDDRPQLQRNTLFLNRGDGTFAQIAELADLDASGWSWGTMFLDVDLDGFEDLLVTTGHPWDLMDADAQEKLRNRLSDVDWLRQRETYPSLELPNYAFRNRGDLRFEEVSDAWRFNAGPDLSHGIAAGDLDQDGDLDVVINRLGAPALVLRNDAAAPRVAVELLGRAPNTAGVGATVRVTGGGSGASGGGGAFGPQSREVTAGGLYLSHSDPLLTFAAGSADSVMIEVQWRGGARSVIAGARPNRLYQIREPETSAAPPAPSSPSPATEPMFADETDRLGHRHQESAFDDASRQLLLPNSFSQLGPGLSWYDLDGDGDDDLLAGTGRGGALDWYRNDGRRFTAAPLGAAPWARAPGDLTTLLAVPAERGTIVLAGVSSYEATTPAEAVAIPSVMGIQLDSRGRLLGPPTAAVPPDTASVGPLAVADYDQDGDLDLFVGGRIFPGAYPLSPSSRLFLNDGTGRFLLDLNGVDALRHLGMVSSALFADLDGDGDPDLVLAIEWGPIKVFLNADGRFSPAGGLGFERWFSRWLGVATGDFDEDGRLDLVTTSWGRNTRTRADSLHPLLLYFGNFDSDETIDLVLARHDERLGAVAPLASFGRLSRAITGVAERVRTFTAYADATIDRVLDTAGAKALRLGANSLDHVLWLNRGDRFEPRPLPLEAQFAPSFGPVVGDFDGDGHDDLALSQNFFPTDLNSPRYDAGRSLLLQGDGRGSLRPVAGGRSGLLVYGDQRGAAAADYDRDGRLDLVIGQNGTATRLFRNRTAAPGVRVRLEGPRGNPFAIGAQLRLVTGSGMKGPVREIQGASGFWSQSSLITVLGRLGRSAESLTVEVRWPDGRRSETPIPAGAAEVRVRPPVR